MENGTNTNNGTLFIYKLTLDDYISENKPGELILQQGTSVLFDDKEKKVKYIIALLSIKVNRKIYQPTEIEAEIDIMQTTTDASNTEKTTAPSFEAVTDMLLKRSVKLEFCQQNNNDAYGQTNAYTIAENCYVYELNPMLKRDANGTKMYVKLNIFSMDKLMTLNKYSKAYVARKLGSGILKPESLTFGMKNDREPLIKTNIKGLRFLKYDEEFSLHHTDGRMTLTNIPSEFIQPYLVQYNESFYDFLVRTSNRCGEFLYFEDGELTLGLPDSGKPLMIDDFESVTVQSVTPPPFNIPLYARDSAKEGKGAPEHFNYTPVDKKSDGYPDGVFPETTSYNSELATDEYIIPLYKDKATDLEREMMFDGGHQAAIFNVMKTVKNYAKSTKGSGKAIVNTVVQTYVPEAIQVYFVNRQATKINESLYKNFFTPLKGNSEQCDGDKMVQFGTLSAKGWTSLNYYSDIRQHEEKQQREIICINMSTHFYPVKLGQKIGIPGSDKTYVVIQIIQNSEGKWQQDYETYNGSPAEHSGSQRTMKIFAIPSYEDENKKECFIPPVQPVPVIRKSGPQTAFVVAGNDPKFQGRVRITYPWQSLGTQVQERLEAATSALQEAQENQKRVIEKTAQLRKEHKLLLTEKEEMEEWARKSDSEREIRRKELEEEIKKLEQSIQNRENAISQATKAIRDKELEIDNLPADTENREARLRELEEDKQILILKKSETIKENEPKIAEDKEALARKKAHLTELTEVEDDSKKDTVLHKKQRELDNVTYNLIESEDKEKAAEIDVKAKEKAEEKAKEDENKKLESIATPWIRIATPVATEGGGFFYEPRQGDEVLVNFDNDNIERPYVVGQLYSKNTLDPRERMNRKLSLRGLGSMALVSPNGHHIAFQDPEDGSKFLNSTIPGVAGVNKLATLGIPVVSPILNFSALHPKKAKDLTGGIHLGDRYGLYEISMSSDSRKITISSPLGQVNINAFTGISIDAPNGDIKIRGKNVDISAGNKVTIESGTNIGLGGGIGKLSYRYTNDKHWDEISRNLWWTGFHAFGHEVLLSATPEAGKQAYKELFPVANVEFLRYFVQVFLRPIDGTMLIKSHKYMLLEAGQGKAMVKDSRYKKRKADDYFMVYESLIICVDYIQYGLMNFFDTYASLWEKAFNAKQAWKTGVVDIFFKKDEAPDIPKAVYQYCDDKPNQNWDAKVVTDLLTKNKFKAHMYKEDNIKKVMAYADAYGQVVFNLCKHVKKAEDLMTAIYKERRPSAIPAAPKDKLPADVPQASYIRTEVPREPMVWVLDILEETVNEAKLLDEWKNTYETGGELNDKFLNEAVPKDVFSENKTEFKRRMAAMFLLNFSKSDPNKQNKYIHIAYNEYHFAKDSAWWKLKGSAWRGEKLSKDYYWKRFVQNMDRYIQNSNFWRALMMSFANSFYNDKKIYELWRKTDVWDKTEGGQILMSDNRDYTLSLVKDGVRSDDEANQFNLVRLTEKLYDVK